MVSMAEAPGRLLGANRSWDGSALSGWLADVSPADAGQAPDMAQSVRRIQRSEDTQHSGRSPEG